MAFTFNSRRSPVYGRNGMVACTQPLAADAGLTILKAGGNAVDAAVAVAAAMNGANVCASSSSLCTSSNRAFMYHMQ